MEDNKGDTTINERAGAFLDRVPLPLRLRIGEGSIDYAAYRAGSGASPSLADYAGARGELRLYGRRVAEASVDGDGDGDGEGSSVGLSNPAFGSEPSSLEAFLLDVPFPLRVELAARELSLSEAEGLAEGDLLAFDRLAGEPVDLVLEEPRMRLGRGEVVSIGGSFGLRLTEACLPEPMGKAPPAAGAQATNAPRLEARLVLGSAAPSLRTILALGPGSVVELAAPVGEPARLELAEDLALDAEVAIVDERFCARILPSPRPPAAQGPEVPEAEEPSADARIEAIEAEVRGLAGSLGEEIAGLRAEIGRALERPALAAATEPAAVAVNPVPALAPEGVDSAFMAALNSSPDAAARGISALCASGRASEAAIALVAAGPDLASELFKRLRIDEVETLTFEIARLEKVGAEDMARALSSLSSFAQGAAAFASGGIDYAREVLEKSLGSQGAIEVINRLTDSLQVRPFDFVRQADPVLVADLIQAEHPQTIALVLSFLEPGKAAVLLARLPEGLRGEVIRRVAALGRVSCTSVREIERVLEKKLADVGEGESLQAGGPEAVVEILNLVDRATEKSLVEFLEEEAPILAEEVKKKMFVFEDIVLLDDRSIQKTLREIEGQELAKALKGVGAEVQEKFFRNMSQRAVMMLKEDMAFMGPVRMADVEAAQQGIVAVVRKLEEIGEIVIARVGDDLIG